MAYTAIKNPSEYFNTVLYTGNGTGQSITGVGFQPDWVWTKRRNTTGQHFLQNIVQGTNKALFSDSTSAEFTGGVDGGTSVTSFDSDGFTLGTEGGINGSGGTFASWNWLASNTTASNTDGDITSTVSVNTTSGFSVLTYTGNSTAGATVGHGLGVSPKLVIAKIRSGDTNNWGVYLKGTRNWFGEADRAVYLDSTSGSVVDGWLNNTQPDSSVVTLSGGNYANTSNPHIMYCFSEVKGFSQISDYLGNGNADGAFVYTGFKPKFVMIKRADSTGDWVIYDSVKEPFNPIDTYLEANSTNADTTLSAREVDILSNGFKVRGTNTSLNDTGGVYGYVAFAEEPLVGDNPATAH